MTSRPLFIIVAQCVVATESKGAYLAGAAAIAAALVVGRTFVVQISLAALLFIAGGLMWWRFGSVIFMDLLAFAQSCF